MMRYYLIVLGLCLGCTLQAQWFEVGMETVMGSATTSFQANLEDIVGFSEIEISDADLDSALALINLDAPRWLKELFPGIRIDVDSEISKRLNRNVRGVRFYVRLKWVGASLTVSDPRLTVPEESKKLKNQLKSLSLSLAGDAEGLAEHVAVLALADATRVKPFFNNRYDVDAYAHIKKIVLGEDPLLVWGKKKRNAIDLEVTGGIRFTADPSPVVDLGSVLFISQRLDSLMEGGLLAPVENITDEIADAVQNVLFGNFRDPRVVPSMGWYGKVTVPFYFGNFAVVGGTEYSVNNHLALKGTKPMRSIYHFVGLRYNIIGGGSRQRE